MSKGHNTNIYWLYSNTAVRKQQKYVFKIRKKSYGNVTCSVQAQQIVLLVFTCTNNVIMFIQKLSFSSTNAKGMLYVYNNSTISQQITQNMYSTGMIMFFYTDTKDKPVIHSHSDLVILFYTNNTKKHNK